MDEEHLYHAVRYVSLNPVRARMVTLAQDWPWSSVRAHLGGQDDGLVSVDAVLSRYGCFAKFLGKEVNDDNAWRALRTSETTGRPIGNAEWISNIEVQTGRTLTPQKRGPKARSLNN